MGLKYKTSDTENLVDVFASISEKKNNPTEVYNEMIKLIDYPIHALQEFLHCMEILSNKNQNYLKENYMGVVGYITLRLNLLND
jgi:hypothetical protein